MIYLDNSATSFPKPKGMILEMEECMMKYCGNPGRSGHYMSTRTGEAVYDVRKNLAQLLGIKNPQRLIFTKNATEAINMALLGILENGDHVITTSMEHNSVLRPLKYLEGKGVDFDIVYGDCEGFVKTEDIESCIRKETKMIVLTAASNVVGTKQDFSAIGAVAKRHGVLFFLDGSQLVGSQELKVDNYNIDILAFPGHKGLLGPQGTGALYVRDGIELKPLMYGGTGTESKNIIHPLDFPDGYESGTVNSPGIIGLGYAIEFLNQVGIETIEFQEKELTRRLDDALDSMNYIKRYGRDCNDKVGITLFNVEGMTSEDVTFWLNKRFAIETRGGFHCAGLAHKTIGTWKSGGVRISVGPFNTRFHIDSLIDALWKLKKF